MEKLRQMPMFARVVMQSAISAVLIALPWILIIFIFNESPEQNLFLNPFMVMFAHYPLIFLLSSILAAMLEISWWMAGLIDIILYEIVMLAMMRNFMVVYLLFDLIFFALGYYVCKRIRDLNKKKVTHASIPKEKNNCK